MFVLIIDDITNDLISRYIQELLKESSHDSVILRTLESKNRYAEICKYDAIIINRDPQIASLVDTFCTVIKKDKPDMPVIVLTTVWEIHEIDNLIEKGCIGLIVPFDGDHLINILEEKKEVLTKIP